MRIVASRPLPAAGGHLAVPEGTTATSLARITGGGANEIKLPQAAGSTDDYYLFTVSSETSAAFVPGLYHWDCEQVFWFRWRFLSVQHLPNIP